MEKNNNFTMIHMMGALMVLVGHAFILFGQEAPLIFADGWRLHEVGVGILFMVSGYLTTLSYIRNQGKNARVGKYLLKRFLRLYPSLIVCLLITVVGLRLITTQPEAYWDRAKLYTVHNLELRPSFALAGVFDGNVHSNAVNGSLWTLPVEVACYFLLVPALELTLRLPRKAGVAFVGALALALSLFSPFHRLCPGLPETLIWWATDWMESTRLIMWFFIGVFFGLCGVRKYLCWQAALVLALLYVCLRGNVRRFFEPYVYSYVVMCFGEAEKPLFARLFKADICYGLYLYAFPVTQLFVYLLIVRRNLALPMAVNVALCVGATWILAMLNHWLVEKPLSRNRFLRRITT